MAKGVLMEGTGRVRRWRRADGDERWEADDPALMRRLASLGRAGIGGFGDLAEDVTGAWLLRRAPARTLADLPGGARLDWQEALGIVRRLALALVACDEEALFPGRLRPEVIVLAPGVWLQADPLIEALVSAPGRPRDASRSTPAKWMPPEQRSGAPWDAAANRYVLGLVAYRLLSGTSAVTAAGAREVPFQVAPFEHEIARDLRPGVGSLVLAMLEPSPDARPGSSREIIARCDALLARAPLFVPEAIVRQAKAEATMVPAASSRPSARHPRSAWTRRAMPVVAGVLLASCALLSRSSSKTPPRRVLTTRPVLTGAADECASCHAREVDEWRRSVMAHAAKSPLFGALESIVEEQVGRDDDCPNGAGILRSRGADVCRARPGGVALTGAGGERWCINCHAPTDNLARSVPAWSARSSSRARTPLVDLLSTRALEGVSCAACHETVGPAHAGGHDSGGNPTWLSITSGQLFPMRPEDGEGTPGISNSGYRLDPQRFLGVIPADLPMTHRRASPATASYLRSSEFCGACHDVRLFGTDTIGVRQRGEHFKRLRNAYSEWRAWAEEEQRHGRAAASCQDCHMSTYPGVCAPGGAGGRDCPSGSHFEARPPGSFAEGFTAPSSERRSRVFSHYFTSVDLPLTPSMPDAFMDDESLDASGVHVGARARRDLLLRHTFRFELEAPRRAGRLLEIPITIENVGAGHRAPAGFSQEREIWVELSVRDARGATVYEVGRVGDDREDLADKIFLRTRTDDRLERANGTPEGVFGADVVDGPDAPAWTPSPSRGGTLFRGKGLINLQNGFLRCVRCIGVLTGEGECAAGPGQGGTRADRFEDGDYDSDTGACRSNLSGGRELFETYFPVGALDADRGITKAPDAIIDTRSAPPGVPLTYTYALDVGAHPAPFRVDARLRFRAFPPYLVRAFADYETAKADAGLRPSGPQVTDTMLRRVGIVDLAEAHRSFP